MIGYLSIILLGFFLGMRHSTDPDHVIAVATIVTRSRKLLEAATVGIAWGIGHTLTVSIVGAGIILFNLAVSPRTGLAMELAVGVMLIVLGLANLRGFRQWMPAAAGHFRESADDPIHSQYHSHGDYVHRHPHEHYPACGPKLPQASGASPPFSGRRPEFHFHQPDQTPLASLDRTFGRLNLYRHARPFIVGIVHGLAGSAAVALLVLATIPNPRWAVAYLALFGAGTIAGMMLITMTMASTFRLVGGQQEWFSRKLRLVSGLVSLAFGLFLAYQICFVHGFLSSSPRWTPH
jgi:ABC-type nickel/cobalt efflux system permease component RcnA